MGRKTIKRAISEDFEILDDGVKVGTVRIRPTGILWKGKGQRGWFGLTLDGFAKLAEEHGKVHKN
mgnify:FL=1